MLGTHVRNTYIIRIRRLSIKIDYTYHMARSISKRLNSWKYCLFGVI